MRAPVGRRPARSIQHYAALNQTHGRVAEAMARTRNAQPLGTALAVRIPKPALRELTAARRAPVLRQEAKPTLQPIIPVPQRDIVLRLEEPPVARPVIVMPVRPAALPPAYWPSHRRRPAMTPGAFVPA